MSTPSWQSEDIEISDFWKLSEELTVQQAALLVVGCDPGSQFSYCESWKVEERPRGYEAVKQAISAGLRAGRMKGTHFGLPEHDFNGNEVGWIEGTTDVGRSVVERESLVAWLASRGVRHGFFFPLATDAPEYLDKTNARYAPKLAAAVRAWQAVTDTQGKHPKQALAKWLRENAAEFGMSDEDGKPYENSIEETAKVANWQPGGGAPKTPGG